MRKIFKKILGWLEWEPFKKETVTANWMDTSETVEQVSPASKTTSFIKYQPDLEFDDVKVPVLNPIIKLLEDFKNGTAHISEAYLFEGMFDRDWKLRETKSTEKPYRIVRVSGDKEFNQKIQECDRAQDRRSQREAIMKKYDGDNLMEAFAEMKRKKLTENFSTGEDYNYSMTTGPYDPGQYTEFTPLFGGPYYKQLYLYDMLSMHARSFEAVNHNPLAKRIIDLLSQYSFGRRFKWRIKDQVKEKAWEDFAKKANLIQRLSKFWVKEYLTFGEMFLDKATWNTVDPSSVWDIITDPDDISKVYYYYQCYSTPFSQFTGHAVPGVPGSEKVKSVEFLIKQLPFDQVMHMKRNVTSYEKRGRSQIYPVLGWLKRYKDLMDSEVIRSQLCATFAWDIEINGSQDDVNAFMGSETDAMGTGKTFYHNQQVKRAPMPAISSSGSNGNGGTANELLAFIATGIGIPKDHFNLIGSSGGNRATALVGAEPFTKLIEDIQADFEHLLLEIAETVIPGYVEGDIEFIFPSVTKDTTTETVANIALGESQSWIDPQTAAEMYAAEMNITSYDYDEVKGRIKQAVKENPAPSIMPVTIPEDPTLTKKTPVNQQQPNGQPKPAPSTISPIHGQGKVDVKKSMNNL